MREWRKSRRFVALLLGGYFCLGMLTRFSPVEEIFPVWAWFLFSSTPQRQSFYSIMLIEVDGAAVPEPVLFQESKGLVPQPSSRKAAALADKLGKAIEAKSPEVESLRQSLETAYMPRVTRYAVVKLSYDPIEYYRTKAHERTEIATLEVKKP